MKTGIIFDLDGVIVSTDENHYQAWKKMAHEEGIPFDRDVNEFLRGVSRMESLEIILKNADKGFSPEQKNEMAERKNRYYRQSLMTITPGDILPGVNEVLQKLKARNIPIAIGSSSKNTPLILERIGMANTFDAVADGNMIKNSKPDPEVFLLAAGLLNIPPESCIVIEDAVAGVEAALNAGMKVVAVGSAIEDERANYRIVDLAHADADEIINLRHCE